MFPPPLRAHLALLVACVAAVSTAPPINAPTESSFAIASPPGSRQTLSGSVDYDPTRAANSDDSGAFTVLAPGESISVTHDLPVTYSFAHSEAGDDSVEPPNPFTYVGADDTPEDLRATVGGIANVKLSRNLVVSRHVHDKRINWRPGKSKSKPIFRHCRDVDETMIKLSGRVAWESLTKAITEIQRTRSDSSHRDHYEVWFGTYAESRGHTVQHNLGQMMDKFSFWGFTFDCDCNEEFPSELLPGRRKIRICKPFWRLTQDEQAAQLLRMAGKLVRTLKVRTTGLHAAHVQATSDPLLASTNLDSYVAFILDEDNPSRPPSSFGSSSPGSTSPPSSPSSSDADAPPPYDPNPPHDPPPPYSE